MQFELRFNTQTHQIKEREVVHAHIMLDVWRICSVILRSVVCEVLISVVFGRYLIGPIGIVLADILGTYEHRLIIKLLPPLPVLDTRMGICSHCRLACRVFDHSMYFDDQLGF